MYKRIITKNLSEWKNKSDRKPLILRGARQVGKTTLVEQFSIQFDTYLDLNLDFEEDKEIFEKYSNTESIIDAIYFIKKKEKKEGSVLLFIDEIQNSPKAVAMLRYFYEKQKDIHVIAAGSLLESLIGKGISFPVGRVEYLPVRPFSFLEFLIAGNDKQSINALKELPFPEYAHNQLLKKFREYSLIGGMPVIVKEYLKKNDIVACSSLFDGLVNSYKEDIEKYAGSNVSREIIRHVIENAFIEAGKRIKYQHFGNSNYKSKEIKEAFLILEKAMLLRLVFPVVSTAIPLKIDHKKSPKLQLLDTGLINFIANIQGNVFGSERLLDAYEGRIAEHVIGQELMTLQKTLTHTYHFWTKEKDSDAEVDYIYTYKNLAIPIEVKAGKTGTLRSLHEYMDRAKHNLGIRVFGGNLSIDSVKTRQGKEYKLLSLPFYLVHQIEKYIEWFIE